jgi:hypothetical protein
MLEIFTAINTIGLIWVIIKVTSNQKIKVFGNKSISKTYPDMSPITVFNPSSISNDDVKNLLISLKNPNDWNIGYFSGDRDGKSEYFMSISNKRVRLFLKITDGKVDLLQMQSPMTYDIIKQIYSHSKKRSYSEENLVDQFTIALWPLFKKGSDQYNDEQSKTLSTFSKDIMDIVPATEVRDAKLNDLLN